MVIQQGIERFYRQMSRALAILGGILLTGLWGWSVYSHAVNPLIWSVVVSGSNIKHPMETTFPYIKNSLSETGEYIFDVKLFYRADENTKLRIVPDDCLSNITINDYPYLLTNDNGQLCNVQQGIEIDLANYIRPGANILQVKIQDTQGVFYGLNIEPADDRMPSRMETLLCLIIVFSSFIFYATVRFSHILSAIPWMLVLFLVTSVFLRMPYFGAGEYWDEGTFLMIGRDVLNGHLPYTHLFDNKPWLVYITYAFFELFPPEDIVSVRFMMALYLGIVAYITYYTSRASEIKFAGLFGALFTLLIFSVPRFTYGYSYNLTLTEHLASLPVAALLCLLLKPEKSSRCLIFIGFCIAGAALFRINLLFLGFVPAVVFFLSSNLPWKKRVFDTAFVAIGVMTPFLALFGLYASIGQVQTLYNSMVLAPLTLMSDFGQIDIKTMQNTPINVYKDSYSWLISLLINGYKPIWLLIGIGMLWTIITRQKKILRAIICVLAVGFFTALSIIASANHYEHYIIQLTVPIALLAGFCTAALFSSRLTAVISLGIILFCLSYAETNIKDGKKILYDWNKGLPLLQQSTYKVAEYMLQNGSEGEYVYSCQHSLINYFSKTNPPSLHAHPHNNERIKMNTLLMRRPYDASIIQKEILAMKPKYIVYPYWWCDTLAERAKQEGYHDTIEIDGFRLLESP